MSAGFTLKGSKAMERRILVIAAQHPGKVEGGLLVEGEVVMTTSKRNNVPRDLGTLRNSGHVQPVVRRGDDFEVTLVYGGAAAPYAIAVHENPSSHDPPSWQGKTIEFNPPGHGQKYLERPLMDAVPGMAGRIAARIKP